MKWILALTVLIVSAIIVVAEEDDDKKKVKTDAMLFGDVKSGEEHIPFATVTIKGTTIGTAADATGHFKMTNLPAGKQTLVISAIGYQQLEKDVVLVAKKSATLLIDLKTDNIGSILATAEDLSIFIRALNDGSVFRDKKEQEIYTSIYKYEHTGLIPGYQTIAKYHKDIDAVVIQFTNTVNFEGYNWNMSEIMYNKIVKIVRKKN